mgnify:CR=1 FL=1
MNKELSTFEGIARIKNFTDKKVIEANRFSQEIIFKKRSLWINKTWL